MPYGKPLTELVALLQAHQSIWRANAFTERDPHWIKHYPGLANWLLGLSDQELDELDQDPDTLVERAASHLPDLHLLVKLCEFPDSTSRMLAEVNPRHFSHIPGRKWQQIRAFAAALPTTGKPVLEWCSGKGHLGRLVAASQGGEVLSLEYDQALCEHGEELAGKAGVKQHFVCQDALADKARLVVKPEQHALALHACGDLHLRLLETAIASGTHAVTISPCCYHLTAEAEYQPRSEIARQNPLSLDKQALRLAVQEVATAPGRVRQQRHLEMAYRLGYQQLVEQLQPGNERKGVPSCGKKALNDGFESFCRKAAQHQGVELPFKLDWQSLQQQGAERWQRMRRLQLANQLFRAALETYLVLDRALWLEESGYAVTVSRFTKRSITPRNFLIQATKP